MALNVISQRLEILRKGNPSLARQTTVVSSGVEIITRLHLQVASDGDKSDSVDYAYSDGDETRW